MTRRSRFSTAEVMPLAMSFQRELQRGIFRTECRHPTDGELDHQHQGRQINNPESKRRDRNCQRQATRVYPTAGNKNTPNGRQNSIPNSRKIAYPTARQSREKKETKYHTHPQGLSSTSGHRPETWRSQARCRSRRACSWGCWDKTAHSEDRLDENETETRNRCQTIHERSLG